MYKKIILSSLAIGLIISSCTTFAHANDAQKQSLEDLSFLLGKWSVVTTYRPGTEKAMKDIGVRECSYAFSKTYIKCDFKMTLEANGMQRDTTSLINYNPFREMYELTMIFDRPTSRALGDMTWDPNTRMLKTKAYIYAGIGHELRDLWMVTRVTDNNHITAEVRSNQPAQAPNEWPVFWQQELTRIK